MSDAETTAVGPVGTTPPTEQDKAMLTRRVGIQTYFNAYESDPSAIVAAMINYGVNAAELTAAMDYRINITHYLRDANVPDGFGGLKVWSEPEIAHYIDWQAAQPDMFKDGAIGHSWADAGITSPHTDKAIRHMAQDAMDTAQRRAAMSVSYVAPWLV